MGAAPASPPAPPLPDCRKYGSIRVPGQEILSLSDHFWPMPVFPSSLPCHVRNKSAVTPGRGQGADFLRSVRAMLPPDDPEGLKVMVEATVEAGGIGEPVLRKEDLRLLRGRGRYTDDVRFDGQAYAAMLRSPHAHARIAGIDTAAAQAVPGAVDVLTAADLAGDGVGTVPSYAKIAGLVDLVLENADGTPRRGTKLPVIADGRVRFVGDIVACRDRRDARRRGRCGGAHCRPVRAARRRDRYRCGARAGLAAPLGRHSRQYLHRRIFSAIPKRTEAAFRRRCTCGFPEDPGAAGDRGDDGTARGGRRGTKRRPGASSCTAEATIPSGSSAMSPAFSGSKRTGCG